MEWAEPRPDMRCPGCYSEDCDRECESFAMAEREAAEYEAAHADATRPCSSRTDARTPEDSTGVDAHTLRPSAPSTHEATNERRRRRDSMAHTVTICHRQRQEIETGCRSRIVYPPPMYDGMYFAEYPGMLDIAFAIAGAFALLTPIATLLA